MIECNIHENLTPMENHSTTYIYGRPALPGNILGDMGTLIRNVNMLYITYNVNIIIYNVLKRSLKI